MQFIRGKDGNIKVNLEAKMEVWKEYEEKLLNEENEWSGELNVEKSERLRENVGESSCRSTESHESKKSARTKWRSF